MDIEQVKKKLDKFLVENGLQLRVDASANGQILITLERGDYFLDLVPVINKLLPDWKIYSGCNSVVYNGKEVGE